MNLKKITVILIAIAFGVVVLCSTFFLLTIKKVDVNYAVAENRNNTDQVQTTLDNLLGKSMLFFNEQDVELTINNYPYLEVVSVTKKYPNVLSVEIKERKEVYRIKDGDKTYVLNEEGIVLNDTGELLHGTKIIDLSFISFRNNPEFVSKITIESANVGKKIQTSNDTVVFNTLDIAKKVGLSDCINKIYVEDCTGGEYDVSFETHTGAKIYVVDVMNGGERKGLTAFRIYDTIANDYQKRFGLLESSYIENQLRVQHTYDDIDDIEDRNDELLYSEDI